MKIKILMSLMALLLLAACGKNEQSPAPADRKSKMAAIPTGHFEKSTFRERWVIAGN